MWWTIWVSEDTPGVACRLTSPDKRNLQPVRVLAGTFMTSLDASGFSITLLKATPEMLEAIDEPTSAVGWPRSVANPAAFHGKQIVNTPMETLSRSTFDNTGPKSE